VTPARSIRSAELRFDILGCPIQVRTPSPFAESLIRRLYAGYPDPPAGTPDVVLQLGTVTREGNRLWSVSAGGDEIAADPRLGPMLNRLEFEICRRVIEYRRDRIMLHGALLSRDGTSLFLSGASGAGKSTLALALSGRGFQVATDDVVLLDPGSASVDAIPRCFHLDLQSKRLLRDAGVTFPWRSLRHDFVTPADLETSSPSSQRLDTLICLHRTNSDTPELTPLSQAEMTGFLLHESAWGRHSAGEVLQTLTRLTGQARCYKLVMGRLDASVRLLDQLACSRLTPGI